MKTLLKIFIGIAVAFIFAIAAAFYLTSGITKTAIDFFIAVKSKEIDKAKGCLADEFKAGTDDKAISELFSTNALRNYKEAHWSERAVNNGRGELTGSITTDSGGVVPIKLVLVKENGEWKIYSLQIHPAGVSDLPVQDQPLSPPAKAERIKLIKRSMHDFAVSVNAGNMDHFRSTISQFWSKQMTIEKFNEGYASTMGKGLDLTVLDGMQPEITDQPTVDENGILTLQGYFPSTPLRVYFRQKFILEGVDWKLIGFSIETK